MPDFYRLDVNASLTELKTDAKSGLSPDEVDTPPRRVRRKHAPARRTGQAAATGHQPVQKYPGDHPDRRRR